MVRYINFKKTLIFEIGALSIPVTFTKNIRKALSKLFTTSLHHQRRKVQRCPLLEFTTVTRDGSLVLT